MPSSESSIINVAYNTISDLHILGIRIVGMGLKLVRYDALLLSICHWGPSGSQTMVRARTDWQSGNVVVTGAPRKAWIHGDSEQKEKFEAGAVG